MTLHDVKVGDTVFNAFKHTGWGNRPAQVYLSVITHIDKKGRLYIAQEGSDCLKNFRYGFDPETGRNAYGQYNHHVLSLADGATVDRWNAIRDAKIDAKERERRTERRKAVFARFGELSYATLKGLNHGQPIDASAVLTEIEQALFDEAREWAQWRKDYRDSEGSQTHVTSDDLGTSVA